MSGKILKEGYLIKRAMKSGRNWKKRYFVLTVDGVIEYGDKQGDAPKNRLQLSPNSTVSILPESELGGDTGFVVSSPGHNPLYLKVKKSERDTAEDWLAAIAKVIKKLGGGKSTNVGDYEAYARMNSTLQRQQSGSNLRRRNKTLERTRKKGTDGDEKKDEDMPEGFKMKIGKTKGAPDYFVSAKTWEYYNSAEDCKQGKPPLGKAMLALLV